MDETNVDIQKLRAEDKLGATIGEPVTDAATIAALQAVDGTDIRIKKVRQTNEGFHFLNHKGQSVYVGAAEVDRRLGKPAPAVAKPAK